MRIRKLNIPYRSSRPFDLAPYQMAAAAALIAALLIPYGALDHTPVICPFRLVTGLPCPACGLTRSWIALMHGHLTDSLALNPFGPLTVIAAVVLVLGIHKRFPDLAGRLQSRPIVGAAIGVWLAVWVVRLVVARA